VQDLLFQQEEARQIQMRPGHQKHQLSLLLLPLLPPQLLQLLMQREAVQWRVGLAHLTGT
jgi:hypothetical protein